MRIPMPSPRGTNKAGLYIDSGFLTPGMALDSDDDLAAHRDSVEAFEQALNEVGDPSLRQRLHRLFVNCLGHEGNFGGDAGEVDERGWTAKPRFDEEWVRRFLSERLSPEDVEKAITLMKIGNGPLPNGKDKRPMPAVESGHLGKPGRALDNEATFEGRHEGRGSNGEMGTDAMLAGLTEPSEEERRFAEDFPDAARIGTFGP
jgi:hypothetical protein